MNPRTEHIGALRPNRGTLRRQRELDRALLKRRLRLAAELMADGLPSIDAHRQARDTFEPPPPYRPATWALLGGRAR